MFFAVGQVELFSYVRTVEVVVEDVTGSEAHRDTAICREIL